MRSFDKFYVLSRTVKYISRDIGSRKDAFREDTFNRFAIIKFRGGENIENATRKYRYTLRHGFSKMKLPRFAATTMMIHVIRQTARIHEVIP